MIALAESLQTDYSSNLPYPHIVIDNFLSGGDANNLSSVYPEPSSPIWLSPYRSEHQYGKIGTGSSAKFKLLDDYLYFSLLEFNSSNFLNFLECITKIKGLLPDPYFRGGGLQQILEGGILDIHTDFNEYRKLKIYRRLNVLLYLTKEWEPGNGGELELWDSSPPEGKCTKKIAPLFNRMVIFETNKNTFHGHPSEWISKKATRRSIALYYYTSYKKEGYVYNKNTEFQHIAKKDLPPIKLSWKGKLKKTAKVILNTLMFK